VKQTKRKSRILQNRMKKFLWFKPKIDKNKKIIY
jgi:hypothetical protein